MCAICTNRSILDHTKVKTNKKLKRPGSSRLLRTHWQHGRHRLRDAQPGGDGWNDGLLCMNGGQSPTLMAIAGWLVVEPPYHEQAA